MKLRFRVTQQTYQTRHIGIRMLFYYRFMWDDGTISDYVDINSFLNVLNNG